MASQTGSCFCGKVKIAFTGEPNAHVLCHCLDCRKISGSNYSNNAIIPETNWKVTGTPKTITKIADTGKSITSHFCGDCGTTLFRTGESFPGAVILKTGVIDDPEWPVKNAPKGELFVGHRSPWTPALDGAQQVPGMP